VSPFEYLSHNCTFACALGLQAVTLTSTVYRVGLVELELCLKFFFEVQYYKEQNIRRLLY